jgi:chloramphenicol 3-O phosphotransferase
MALDVLQWNRVVAALAEGGDDVIVDIVLRDAVERWRPFRVLFVALHCPVEELERREAARGRRPGLTRGQAAWVQRAGICDLALDKSRCSPEACARQIVEALAFPPSPSAFERLDAHFAAGEIGKTFFRGSD